MINVPNSTEGIGLRYTFIAGSNTKVIVYNFDILSNIICNFLCDWRLKTQLQNASLIQIKILQVVAILIIEFYSLRPARVYPILFFGTAQIYYS